MCYFKPSDPSGDLVESSDDLEGMAGINSAEESDADDSDDSEDSTDDEDIEAVEIADVGEEAGKPNNQENPFFAATEEDSEVSDTDDDSDLEAEETKDDPEEEDDLIKALKAAREKKVRNSPPDIKTSELITDLSFHPEADIIALGNISGDLSIFSYNNEENKMQKKLKLSKKTLRGLEFDEAGTSLLTISKDKTFRILDTETWTVKTKYVKCHDSPLYSCASLGPHISVTGDEDGFVKMWDNRLGDTSIMTFKRFDEYVSSFLKMDENHLIAASGEGTIQSFDLRQKKPDIQSEMYDGELNCMGTVRTGTKLVVGSGTGPLYLFSKDQYGLHSDQFPGHPDGVNALIPITDNVLITGCEDGNVRAVHLYPHRFLGVVGHHEDEFPIERLDVNTSGEIVASISHDNRVKFWNVTYLEEMDYDKQKKPGILPKTTIRSKSKKLNQLRETEHQLPSSSRTNKKEFFSGFKEDE
eukprot:GFUD01025153.1.p1 GENE.GFUD01025153.1~~GFUD01025153.1.p1  ORF type:complete len:471 (-),score=144.87 GFUD01025153.1:1127-2539(-)